MIFNPFLTGRGGARGDLGESFLQGSGEASGAPERSLAADRRQRLRLDALQPVPVDPRRRRRPLSAFHSTTTCSTPSEMPSRAMRRSVSEGRAG